MLHGVKVRHLPTSIALRESVNLVQMTRQIQVGREIVALPEALVGPVFIYKGDGAHARATYHPGTALGGQVTPTAARRFLMVCRKVQNQTVTRLWVERGMFAI